MSSLKSYQFHTPSLAIVFVLVADVVIDDVVIVAAVQANFPEVGLTYAIITAE